VKSQNFFHKITVELTLNLDRMAKVWKIRGKVEVVVARRELGQATAEGAPGE
jgi:hypothetical protein